MVKTNIRQSAKALLASITKEMAQPRVAESARPKIGKPGKNKLGNPA